MKTLNLLSPSFRHRKLNIEKGSTSTIAHPFLRKLRRIIQINFDNEQFDVACLAQQIHLSVSQLNRKLNALIKQPAGQLIWEMRMDHAASLLAQDVASIGEVALRVGYKNQGHFCRSFKRKFHCTPMEFRKMNQY